MFNVESIQLDKDSSQALYIQLYVALKTLIERDNIKVNAKLPPIRKLAEELGVNSVTVVNAYKLLEQHGLVYSKVGSGTYVAPLKGVSAKDHNKAEDEFYNEELKLMDQGQIKLRSGIFNFASATPTPELFPVDDFKNVLNEVLDRDKGYAFGYQESQGYYPLRESIANYINDFDYSVLPEDIQIISGAQQGIDILAKALLEFGDYLIVESPTYTGAIAAFRSRGAQIIEVPMEPDGINLNILEDKLKKFHPKFIYVMPNFHNPTGYTYSSAKRRMLLELATRYNTLVIEDDYLSELDYAARKLTPLKALDKQNNVIYLKSFSKIFMPGLRLAFLSVPKEIYSGVLAAKHTSDISTSGLIQRAFDLYLRKGFWQKHIALMREIYYQRYRIMLQALKQYLPKEIDFFQPKGGLTFWLGLPEGYYTQELYLNCEERDVLFIPGSIFFPQPRLSRFFRLSFASVYPGDIAEGIRILSKVAHQMLHSKNFEHRGYTPLL
ncbi:PLP-dependent aminotransferase family protein [Bacillota bacterium LX-D]|nr:PLP-dependent aminotransferase family protein [Bacillota bacterium LX-D]